MKVWRKQTVRYIKDGKRVPKGTRGAQRKTEHSKRFYGTLRTASGKRKQTPLTEDEKTSQRLLVKLQGDEDRKAILGVTEEDERAQTPISKALPEYIAYLTMKGNTAEYVKTCNQRLTKLLKAVKAKTISDLDSGKVLKTLNDWRKGISLETINHYIRAVKGFAKWLRRERLLKDDPFVGLKTFNSKVDKRRNRRAFTDDELKRLLSDTQVSSKRYRGNDWQFLPVDRVMLYRIAANTGLRAKEISSLTVSNFELERRILTVAASNTKNRQQAVLPLSQTFCETLAEYFKRLKTDRLFPGSWNKRRMAGKMLKRDMVRAGICAKDAQGRTLDFHSLRYTFVSNLAKGKVHPSQAQKLARHSDINLTMSVYTDLSVDDLRDAIDTLPTL
ncbi:MAG: tyrosine-type recombinase/integrase [Planctomycetaceae bacterium]|nr:tyrosine-type recombinase/integrase [Planctomycetaceae bacterium]MCB9949721.1 tyrosine-type recombinase/integrase [Planctomycetaceae bacterium]